MNGWIRAVARAVGVAAISAGVAAALVGLALTIAPEARVSAAAGPARRPPIVPPAVPLGAPEYLAQWSYIEKVNQAWGKDWPTAIRFLEEFTGRYPTNPTGHDALYAAYIEDGKELRRSGEVSGARRRFQQAADFDEDRGEAYALLEELANEP